jgi:hypothetical protein
MTDLQDVTVDESADRGRSKAKKRIELGQRGRVSLARYGFASLRL